MDDITQVKLVNFKLYVAASAPPDYDGSAAYKAVLFSQPDG